MRHFTIENSPVCCAFFDEVLFSKPIFVYMAWKDGVQEAIFVDELSGRDQMGQKPFYKILI